MSGIVGGIMYTYGIYERKWYWRVIYYFLLWTKNIWENMREMVISWFINFL